MIEILILIFFILNLILQVYDGWSTIKIKKGPDGKLNTKDDGIEKNKFMRFLMEKIGVIKTIIITKIVGISLISGLYFGQVFNYIDPNISLMGFIFILGLYLYMFVKYNFKYDGIGENE